MYFICNTQIVLLLFTLCLQGRSALFLKLKLQKDPQYEFVVCGTHLTEKVVGKAGQRQKKMVEALLKICDEEYPLTPTILTGDFNINNVKDLPDEVLEFCKGNPFIHPHDEHNLYDSLTAAGFTSAQAIANTRGLTLPTCWNSCSVDYMGSRGIPALAVSVLSPKHKGVHISDHGFPIGVYSFS